MTDQLSLFIPQPAAAPTGLPPCVARILHAARSLSFSTRIVRGCWGVGVGQNRKWVLASDRCCALGALLVVEGAQIGEKPRGVHTGYSHHVLSPIPSVARTLGVDQSDVRRFVDGYDGLKDDDGSAWFGYGRRVAEELGVQ